MSEHDDIRSLLGVYALDAIDDPDERLTVESHLETCAECRSEVDAHRSVTAALAEAELTAPPGLWDRIEESLEAPAAGPSHRRWSMQTFTSIAAVLAVATAVGMTALWVGANTTVKDLETRLSALEAEADRVRQANPLELAVDRALSSGSALEVILEGESGTGTAVVLPDGQGWLTELSFRPLDASQTYQLWAIQDGAVISAGVLGSSPSTLSFHVDAERLDGLVITIEDAGGVVSSTNSAAAAWLADA